MLMLPVLGLAQNDSKYGDTPEQQTLCKEALSVYKSYKKQKNYGEAYQQWKKACDVCPESVQESLYADGATFIKAEIKVAKKAGDDARQAVLIDSLMWAYDKRMQLFPSTKKKPNNRSPRRQEVHLHISYKLSGLASKRRTLMHHLGKWLASCLKHGVL